MGLAGLGARGNLDTDPVAGVLGGALLGSIGAALYASEKKKGKRMSESGTTAHVDKEIAKHLKKVLAKTPNHMLKQGGSLKLAGQGSRGITNEHIKAFIQKHKNVKIHISDILGKDWQRKKEKLKTALGQAIIMKGQKGGNVWGSIKHGFSKVGHSIEHGLSDVGKFTNKAASATGKKLKDFVDGKTKLKPSTLLNYLEGAVGVVGAASAFIPGVDLISVPTASALALGLKGAATVAKTSGRGNVLPVKHLNFIKKNPDKARMIIQNLRKVQSGKGMLTKAALGASGLALYGFLKENPHLINQAANALIKRMSGDAYH